MGEGNKRNMVNIYISESGSGEDLIPYSGIFLLRYVHICTHALEKANGEFPCLSPRIITVPYILLLCDNGHSCQHSLFKVDFA